MKYKKLKKCKSDDNIGKWIKRYIIKRLCRKFNFKSEVK